MKRATIIEGQHKGSQGRIIWYFRTGGPSSVLVMMILLDSGEVVHVQSPWIKIEEAVSE